MLLRTLVATFCGTSRADEPHWRLRHERTRDRADWRTSAPCRCSAACAALSCVGSRPRRPARRQRHRRVCGPRQGDGQLSRLEVPLNQTAKFRTLKITPRACYTRAPTEPPKTTTFVEIDEVHARRQGKAHLLRLDVRRQPGLNAVEHPVFDVWLTDCTAHRPQAPRRASPRTTPGRRTASACRGEPQPPIDERAPARVAPARDALRRSANSAAVG